MHYLALPAVFLNKNLPAVSLENQPLADRIYVTYTPTGVPGSFHTAIHYERTDSAGHVVNHHVIEAKPEMKDLTAPEKAIGVIEEVFRTGNAPSRFGRIDAQIRNRGATDRRDETSDDPNAPYEVIAEDDDLSDQLARMQLFAHGFNRAALPIEVIIRTVIRCCIGFAGR